MFIYIYIYKLIVGLGEACDIARREMDKDEKHVRKIFNKMLTTLQNRIPHIKVNGDLVY